MEEVWKDITLSLHDHPTLTLTPLLAHPLPKNPHQFTALNLFHHHPTYAKDKINNGNPSAPPPPPPNHLDPISLCGRKRDAQAKKPDTGGELERRKKRMIKNRESASRSRARKQAYTNDLEIEVARLADENSKLRRQFDELRLAMGAQVPVKRVLLRTSSAPV
ncbi:protein FD-like [Typha latifolia]|uniref:protein FD-like n=1 Tax=Typha latifolia TaxID=4733 RepID=UPI003C2B93D4